MSRNIPLFEMFAALQLSGELRRKLAGVLLTRVSIRQETRSASLEMKSSQPVSQEELDQVKAALLEAYGLGSVEIRMDCVVPECVPVEESWKQAAVTEKPAKSARILMGSTIRGRPVEMSKLNLKMSLATVEGKVFDFDCKETRRPGLWRLHFEMTDYTSSVTVQRNVTEKEARGLEKSIEPGMWLRVQGKMEATWDGKDIQLVPQNINVVEHAQR